MLTNPMTHFGEGEEQRSPTSLPVITEGNVLFCDGTSTRLERGIGVYKKPQNQEKNHPKPQNCKKKKFTQT